MAPDQNYACKLEHKLNLKKKLAGFAELELKKIIFLNVNLNSNKTVNQTNLFGLMKNKGKD